MAVRVTDVAGGSQVMRRSRNTRAFGLQQ